MLKINGYNYKLFCAEPWPKDWWVEDGSFTVNGTATENGDFPDDTQLLDSDIVSIRGGYVYCLSDSGTQVLSHLTYERMIRNWLKKQTEKVFLVSCNNTNFDAVITAIKKAGGKTVK